MKIIDGRHGTPADVERRMHIRGCPFKYFAKFFPVSYFFKFKGFNRSASNNKSIKLAVLDFVPRIIKINQMFFIGILGFMAADANKREFHLQGGCPNQSRYLRFGSDFIGHQV